VISETVFPDDIYNDKDSDNTEQTYLMPVDEGSYIEHPAPPAAPPAK
jgi:hypothetical protein